MLEMRNLVAEAQRVHQSRFLTMQPFGMTNVKDVRRRWRRLLRGQWRPQLKSGRAGMLALHEPGPDAAA